MSEMRYQFQVNGRAGGPVRGLWELAARDAVKAGHAIWVGKNEIRLDVAMGADIARFTEEDDAAVKAITARLNAGMRESLKNDLKRILGALSLLGGIAYLLSVIRF